MSLNQSSNGSDHKFQGTSKRSSGYNHPPVESIFQGSCQLLMFILQLRVFSVLEPNDFRRVILSYCTTFTMQGLKINYFSKIDTYQFLIFHN